PADLGKQVARRKLRVVLVDAHGANVAENFDDGDAAGVACEQLLHTARERSSMRVALLLAFVACSTLAACSTQDVRVRYPVLPDQPTGTLVLLLSQAASDVTISING